MTSYVNLLLLILPVFGVMGIGVLLRRLEWLTAEADASLLRLVVNVLYPCIIFENVHANPALREPGNLGWAPLVGFVTMVAGMVACHYAGRLLGFTAGTGSRTFAFSAGIYNYAYLTVPLVQELFGPRALGVLFVHNVGAEAAIWVVGILLLAGESLRTGWHRMLNPPFWALLVAVGVNLTGLNRFVPDVALGVVHALAVCAIPMGILLSGATMGEHVFRRPAELFEWRTSLGAVALRLGGLTGLFLLLAKYGPFSADLKHVILTQSVMPAAFLPLVLVKHYGGQPLVAVRVVLATVVAAIALIPLWLRLGLAWIG